LCTASLFFSTLTGAFSRCFTSTSFGALAGTFAACHLFIQHHYRTPLKVSYNNKENGKETIITTDV
jgi:hypothetical protein